MRRRRVQRRTPKTFKSTLRIGRRNAENASESGAEITNFLCLLSLADRTGVKKTLDERRRNLERIRNWAIGYFFYKPGLLVLIVVFVLVLMLGLRIFLHFDFQVGRLASNV